MGATALSMLTVGLDTTVLTVALPDMAVSLGASTAQLQWFADSYLLVLGALLLPAGMLGDRFGRKRLTVGALTVFGVGSLWCAFAGSPASLIAARTLLGVGAAVLIPLAMSSVVVLFEAQERSKAVMVLGAASMLGLPLGPIVGGALLQHFWWGSVFLINIPVVVLAIAAVIAFLPESRTASTGGIDLGGLVLSVLGLLGVSFGLIEGPARGWTSLAVLTSLVGGAVLLVAFLLLERRPRQVEPVFDVALWRNPSFRWGTVAAAVASLAFFALLFVVPQYLRSVQGVDALGTGLRTLPLVAGLVVGLRAAMQLGSRLGARAVGVGGFLITAVGLGIGATTAVGDGYWRVALWTAVVGIGFGAALFSGQNAALMALPRDRAGAGSALVQTLRQVGSVLGIAGLGAVLNGIYRSRVDVTGVSAEVAARARESVSGGVLAASESGSVDLLISARSAFVVGMDATLWASVAVALLGAVLVLLRMPAAPTASARAAGKGGDDRESEHGSELEPADPGQTAARPGVGRRR
jgi:EmrB/QacA subfamily drug resistance transporter